MSALLLSALAASSSGQGALYVDDVFSTYLYTGNGATQNINGLNFADNAGLVWLKNRTSAGEHYLFDTVRGALNEINSNNTEASAYLAGSLTAFLNNSFSVGNSAAINQSGQNYVGWQFRKAPKFFDVVTYTGDGASNRQIAHSLGVQAGFVAVKATSATGDWSSYHRSATGDLKLNLTDAQTASRAIITAADASTFTVSGAANTNGVSYVAYLWAHDPSADGVIQCGSFTTDASGNATVNLGWEPQFLIYKSSSAVDNWHTLDAMRGFCQGFDPRLDPNTSIAELTGYDFATPTATGFALQGGTGSWPVSTTYIYLAIRRPNKPPTSGTEVFAPVLSASDPGAYPRVRTAFPVDAALFRYTRSSTGATTFVDRLRGDFGVDTNSTSAEYAGSNQFKFDSSIGWGNLGLGSNGVFWNFRRAPGFFDVVCDTGTGAAHAIAHNLTKAPELIIRKSRSAATQWEVRHSALAATEKLVLNSDAAKATDVTAWGSTLPTATQFTVETGANVNANAATFVTYLFATLAGISKCGSYTGNGSSQTIDCGFSTGARFFLVKATSTTGSWWVYDSVRGIVSAADPALQLNSTAAEITSADAVDPTSVGIIVNQEATCSINATGVSYIFLAIA